MTTEAELLRDDDRARAAALDVSRSFIVQAPAGSGKTELLIQRYLRLLATVEQPEEVLAITFTRKAAAEMRIRVIEALRRAARDETPEPPHEKVTAAAAVAVLRRDTEFRWRVIADPGRLRILTLDALNASIARNLPVTATSGAAGGRIVADAEIRAQYQEAAALTFDQLTESGEYRASVLEVLGHLDNHTGLYVEYLARMLATRDQWLPFVGSGSLDAREALRLRQQLESLLDGVVAGQLRRVRRLFPDAALAELQPLTHYAAGNLRNAGADTHPLDAFAGGPESPACAATDAPTWLAIAELLLTAQGEWRRRFDRNLGFPPGDGGHKRRIGDLVDTLRDEDGLRAELDAVRRLPPVRYGDEQWRVLLALFRLLPLTVTELQRLFAERAVSDHIEVALSAARALGTAMNPGEVALLLDHQIRHVLVDEMQDTSSAQYRMLEALTGGWTPDDGRTLFCVGDPMQSIYRFRNAEVGQFLLAQRAGIGDVDLEILTLRRNFRSGAKLVGWFNAVFPDVLALHDDPERSAVSYAPAVSVPALDGQGTCTVHPLTTSATDAEAEAGCRVVGETLAANPGDTVAVLVRSRTQLPALLARLRKAGIAYRAIEIDRLTDLPEIIDVLALTRALAHAGDRLAWLALLRAPWLGLDWTDLHAIAGGDRQRTVLELLHDADRLAHVSNESRATLIGFRDSLAGLFAARADESLRDRTERAWLTLGGPGIVADADAVRNVYRYLDVVEKLEVAGSLPDVAEFEAALDEERVSSDAAARLQVMTMHRAKGLQFDHVVLYGLGRIPRPHTPEVMSWVEFPDEHGVSRNLVSPVGPRATLERDPVHRYIASVEAEKDRYELGRLLYVACTRARQSLHLIGHAREYRSGIRPDTRSLLHLLWPAAGPAFAAADATETDTVAPAGGLTLPVLRRFTAPWPPPEALPLPGAIVPTGPAEPGTPVEYDWVGSAARFAGTLVHRWIQAATEGRIALDDESRGQLRPANERWLREMAVAPDAMPAILERIDSALAGIARDDRGRWLISGPGHAELALTGLVNARIESVFIDRVRFDDDGTHWIVDYKTSTHEGGDLDAFLGAEAERYRPQLTKYANLYRNYSDAELRCALYFPLLQAFVEVPL